MCVHTYLEKLLLNNDPLDIFQKETKYKILEVWLLKDTSWAKYFLIPYTVMMTLVAHTKKTDKSYAPASVFRTSKATQTSVVGSPGNGFFIRNSPSLSWTRD